MVENPAICFLCGRPLGRRVEKHHPVPKSQGGRGTVPVHPICHRKIRAVFTEKQLAQAFHTAEALRAHPEISRFVTWLQGNLPARQGTILLKYSRIGSLAVFG